VPVWQVAHWAVTVTWVWLKAVGFQGCVGLWQAKQLVLPTGTWVLFLPVTPPVPLWQDTQLVAALKVAWSTLPVDQVVVDLWQFSQSVWPV
jgi:hypothetical protein